MEMNLQKYMAFVRTAECGSFTKAAEILQYSQSGISRMISDLEKEWGIALLERGRSGVRLTSDGMKLLPFAQNICNEYRRLHSQIDELNGLKSGLIRIGTFSSVATHWLPKIIKAFQRDYPNIDYELLLGDYAEIERWITAGRVDFGFLRLPTAAELDTTFLENDKLLVVLPEGHPLADEEYFPAAALSEYPFMLLEKSGRSEISDVSERHGIKLNVRFTTWDDYSIMSMVESGLGISVLPELILRRIPYHIVTKELDVPAYREIGMAFRDKEKLPLAVLRFLDYMEHRHDTERA